MPNPSPNLILQADLDKAIPALDAAQKALELLNKKDMAEVKAYAKPPPAVETVMEAVMVLRKQEPTWAEAKKQLGDPNFLMQLVQYDKELEPLPLPLALTPNQALLTRPSCEGCCSSAAIRDLPSCYAARRRRCSPTST